MSTSTTISPVDLINLSKDLAQLNLGYLGISVAILGGLAGVFIYFNLNPIQEKLGKQEKEIEDLRKEARDLLDKSKTQAETIVRDSRDSIEREVIATLEQQGKNTTLEIANAVSEVERILSEKIETVSESKDIKLREVISSEAANGLGDLERKWTESINSLKTGLDKKLVEANHSIDKTKANLKNIERDVKELKVYKYSKEGRMGAIIYSIDLLKDYIDEGLSYRIVRSLESLSEEIKNVKLEADYVSQIEEQIARIEVEPKYKVAIAKVRERYLSKDE